MSCLSTKNINDGDEFASGLEQHRTSILKYGGWRIGPVSWLQSRASGNMQTSSHHHLTIPLKETDIFENQSWCCGASGVGVDNGNEQEHSLYGHVARGILALTTFSMHCHGMHVVFEFWQCSPVSFVSV